MSKIEWTESTWNPVTGCTKISAGCKHCYAETMSRRLTAIGVKGYENGFAVSIHPDRLDVPLKRKKPTVWFVNSMSDLFHPKVPFDFVDDVINVICKTPQHTYQILTKRPGRMRQYFDSREVPANAWLGTSVENKKHGVPRIDELRKIKSGIRFLSVEPLLEDIGMVNLNGIHWVIVGGESGKALVPCKRSGWIILSGNAPPPKCAFSLSSGGHGVLMVSGATKKPTVEHTKADTGTKCRRFPTPKPAIKSD